MRQRLAAIRAADVAGYSRLMAADERATVAALDAARDVFRRVIESNQGRACRRWRSPAASRRRSLGAHCRSGRMDEAAVELKRLMAAYPDLTVTKFKEAMVFSPATLDRMGANVKKAGVPD